MLFRVSKGLLRRNYNSELKRLDSICMQAMYLSLVLNTFLLILIKVCHALDQRLLIVQVVHKIICSMKEMELV